MENTDKILKFFYCSVMIMMLIISGCVSSGKSLLWHLNQYTPSKAAPIDGTWKTPWNDRVIIDRGRMYQPDFIYPMTTLKNIRRIGPGKYRADNTGSKQIQGNSITLSVVSANKLVIITDMTEVAYTLVKIKNSKWHMGDFKLAQKAVSDIKKKKEPIVFHGIKVEPSKVERGNRIIVKASFSINDINKSKKIVPVEYYYEVKKQESALYTSPTKLIQVNNGEKTPLEIELKAASREGEYKIKLRLISQNNTNAADAEFSIVDAGEAKEYKRDIQRSELSLEKPPLEDRLPGKWRFVFPTGQKGPVLTITKDNDQLVASIFKNTARTHWVKMVKNDNKLILTTKAADPTGRCWYIVEDTITFNNEMDKMPVRSKILNGSYCVSIGQIFKSTLYRIK